MGGAFLHITVQERKNVSILLVQVHINYQVTYLLKPFSKPSLSALVDFTCPYILEEETVTITEGCHGTFLSLLFHCYVYITKTI